MFEYWFLGRKGTITGSTHDFLEVCCQITKTFNPTIAGEFVEGLLNDQATNLSFLRVIDWKFEFEIDETRSIKLHKLK